MPPIGLLDVVILSCRLISPIKIICTRICSLALFSFTQFPYLNEMVVSWMKCVECMQFFMSLNFIKHFSVCAQELKWCMWLVIVRNVDIYLDFFRHLFSIIISSWMNFVSVFFFKFSIKDKKDRIVWVEQIVSLTFIVNKI